MELSREAADVRNAVDKVYDVQGQANWKTRKYASNGASQDFDHAPKQSNFYQKVSIFIQNNQKTIKKQSKTIKNQSKTIKNNQKQQGAASGGALRALPRPEIVVFDCFW